MELTAADYKRADASRAAQDLPADLAPTLRAELVSLLAARGLLDTLKCRAPNTRPDTDRATSARDAATLSEDGA